MEILAKLFGNPNRVKSLRLFILNPDTVLTTKDVSRRSKMSAGSARKEVKVLAEVGFIHPKKQIVIKLVGRAKKVVKKRMAGWELDRSFPLLNNLKLLLHTDLLYKEEVLARRFKRAGQIKFMAVSGVFLQDSNSRVDLVLVGTKLKKSVIEHAVHKLESEIGKELNYAVFDTPDFQYRVNACDKFVRDILDCPHHRIINKLAL